MKRLFRFNFRICSYLGSTSNSDAPFIINSVTALDTCATNYRKLKMNNMQAYKLNATIDESGNLVIDEPLNITPGKVEIIIL